MKLSLCIATFNEEKNLHYPLDSAIDFVDEVIIVDGGSTDRTVEVAKSYGKKTKIIISENPVMFHKNKQKAIEAAEGQWILQLDADEELSSELKEEIVKLIHGSIVKKTMKQSNNETITDPVAYWIPRKNWFLTRFLEKGGVYPDYTIRLYKNGVARFPCRDVHENVEIIGQKLKVKNQNLNSKVKSESLNNETMKQLNNGTIGYLKNPILHYADPDFSRYLMRWDRYTTLEVEQMPKSTKLGFFNYFIWKPKITFLMMYFRHKGFMDGFPGFIFALFSSIRFWVIYIKWRIKNENFKL
ncbi:MAG TPA: glycosyltransferase family 2 protein [Patescibacteria group bacterium]